MKNRGYPTLDVETCGLFVSIDQPWVAGTLDRLVHDPDSAVSLGLLEIKNPYSI